MKRCAIYARPTRDLEERVRRRRGCAGRGQKISRASRSTTDLGLHHLRGRAEAMRVYAVVANPSCNGQEV